MSTGGNLVGLGDLIELKLDNMRTQNQNVIFGCWYFFQDWEQEHEVACEVIIDAKHPLYKVFTEYMGELVWLCSDGRNVTYLPQVKKSGLDEEESV